MLFSIHFLYIQIQQRAYKTDFDTLFSIALCHHIFYVWTVVKFGLCKRATDCACAWISMRVCGPACEHVSAHGGVSVCVSEGGTWVEERLI